MYPKKIVIYIEMQEKYCKWDIHDNVLSPSFYQALFCEMLDPHVVLVQKYQLGVDLIYFLLVPMYCAWNSFLINITFQQLLPLCSLLCPLFFTQIHILKWWVLFPFSHGPGNERSSTQGFSRVGISSCLVHLKTTTQF
jgi:hypothetical protein